MTDSMDPAKHTPIHRAGADLKVAMRAACRVESASPDAPHAAMGDAQVVCAGSGRLTMGRRIERAIRREDQAMDDLWDTVCHLARSDDYAQFHRRKELLRLGPPIQVSAPLPEPVPVPPRAHLRKVQAKGPWASSPHGLPKQARWLPRFLHLSEMRPPPPAPDSPVEGAERIEEASWVGRLAGGLRRIFRKPGGRGLM